MSNKKISLIELQRHVENLHPTKTQILENGQQEKVPFGVIENLGTLMPLKSWMGQTSPMARQLGVGPTLFLMSTKALAWFFLFLTCLNIPIF